MNIDRCRSYVTEVRFYSEIIEMDLVLFNFILVHVKDPDYWPKASFKSINGFKCI